MASEFPGLTYDVTIKVEHLLAHAALLPVLADTGCAFVTSAVESVDDEVLARLEKGHDAADFERAVQLCRDAGLLMSPTFVAFTPWTTLDGYCALLQTIDRLDLVDQVASDPARDPAADPRGIAAPRARRRPHARRTVSTTKPDLSLDASRSGRRCAAGVDCRARRPAAERTAPELFDEIWDIAHQAAGSASAAAAIAEALPRAAVPYLNEPWYC